MTVLYHIRRGRDED